MERKKGETNPPLHLRLRPTDGRDASILSPVWMDDQTTWLVKENLISVATAKYDVVGDAEDSPEKKGTCHSPPFPPARPPFPHVLQSVGPSFRFSFFCRKGPSIQLLPDYQEPPQSRMENQIVAISGSLRHPPCLQSFQSPPSRPTPPQQSLIWPTRNAPPGRKRFVAKGISITRPTKSVAGIVSNRLRCADC